MPSESIFNRRLQPVGGADAGDMAHGVNEGPAEHLDGEVNGIHGQIAPGPAPVAGGVQRAIRACYFRR